MADPNAPRGDGSRSARQQANFSTSAATDSPFRADSVSSAGFRGVQFADPRYGQGDAYDDGDANSQLLDDDTRDPYDAEAGGVSGGGGGGAGSQNAPWPPSRRRRSSVGARLVALTDIGGVNSIRSFTRSFQRAANFTEVIPQRPSFIFAADQEPIFGTSYDDDGMMSEAGGAGGGESGSFRGTPPQFLSLLRQSLESGSVPEPSSEAVSLNASSEVGSILQTQQAASGTAAALLDGQQQQQQQQPVDGGGDDDERKRLLDATAPSRLFRTGSTSSIFSGPPHLAAASAAALSAAESGADTASPFAGSYGSYRSYRSSGGRYGSIGSQAGVSYGAIAGRMGAGSQAASMAQAGSMWKQQQQQQQTQAQAQAQLEQVPLLDTTAPAAATAAVPPTDGERPAILVKEVEEDGKIILTVEGQSTLPQTIFNSINVLIGVGLLSLPMGVKYAGWLCGMVILFLAATVTSYTARLLAKCMDLDPAVITFSDLAFISFGPRARLVTSLLFTLELLAACVALIVLFADSLDLLFPGLLTITEWKTLCCLVMVPLNFLPMRLLSVTSIIGIVSCFSIVSIVVIDGLTKKTTPGSLIEPAMTYLFPANWLTLPLSFGLLMSPWGGHSVFPNIYRDMRHPYKYAKAVKVTFSFTYMLDLVTAVAGLLMFGDDVKDEITANILMTSGYPRALTVLLCIFIAIIPLTKIPLNARPIITTVEVLAGMHQQAVATDAPVLVGRSMYFRGLARIAIRVLIIFSFLVIAILFPAFDSIMAFMGSALCFTICVTLPILFHLKLFGHELSYHDKLFQGAILATSFVISIVGTVWSFLPKSLIGVE